MFPFPHNSYIPHKGNAHVNTIELYKIFNKRVLVTRQSARSIASDIENALSGGAGKIVLDFTDVAGVTPSFMDETLSVIEERAKAQNGAALSIIVENSPTKLSSKFAAIGRAHGLDMREGDGATWIITKSGV